MIAFNFKVNRSFLGYPSHPITVPKSQVSYRQLEAEHVGPDVVLIEPGGRRLPGRLNRGEAGFGEYYQVRVSPSANDPLYSLPLGKRLRVEISRGKFGGEVRLR